MNAGAADLKFVSREFSFLRCSLPRCYTDRKSVRVRPCGCARAARLAVSVMYPHGTRARDARLPCRADEWQPSGRGQETTSRIIKP